MREVHKEMDKQLRESGSHARANNDYVANGKQ
jgi:hypothetical protein